MEVSYIPPELPGEPVYTYLILRPNPVSFWIKVTLGHGATATPAQISAIQNALFQDFQGINDITGSQRVRLASTVYAARFYAAALSATEGIKNIQSIEISLSTAEPTTYYDFVDINGDQEPVMATENVIVVTA